MPSSEHDIALEALELADGEEEYDEIEDDDLRAGLD